MDGIRIEPLNDDHERGEFSCGKTPLDVFIRTQAGQHSRKGISRTFVAVRTDAVQVLGYFTMVASSIAFEDMPAKLAKKLPHHPVPSILIARLAVDRSVQGHKLGQILLFDAFRRSVEIASHLGVYAVHVHAIDDDAKGFYERYGFQSLPKHSHHLFLPVDTIREGVGG